MNQTAVIFTKIIPGIGHPVVGLVFNDTRFYNGSEINTSPVRSMIVMNNDPDRYSVLVTTQSGTNYMVYVKTI